MGSETVTKAVDDDDDDDQQVMDFVTLGMFICGTLRLLQPPRT